MRSTGHSLKIVEVEDVMRPLVHFGILCFPDLETGSQLDYHVNCTSLFATEADFRLLRRSDAEL